MFLIVHGKILTQPKRALGALLEIFLKQTSSSQKNVESCKKQLY